MASVELVQPHDSTWLMPRSRSEIEISLDTMPTMETGIAYGVTFRAALDEEIVILALADVDAAAAAADDHARVGLADAQAGVRPRFARGDDADERGARVALRIRAVAGVPEVVALERRHIVHRHVGDGRGDPAPEFGGVELGDRARAAAPAAHVIPEPLAPDAERRHDADAGDHDPRSMVHTRTLYYLVIWSLGH